MSSLARRIERKGSKIGVHAKCSCTPEQIEASLARREQAKINASKEDW